MVPRLPIMGIMRKIFNLLDISKKRKLFLPSDHRVYDINDLFGDQVTIDIGFEVDISYDRSQRNRSQRPPKRTKRKKRKVTVGSDNKICED
jgi:hypothetical protein